MNASSTFHKVMNKIFPRLTQAEREASILNANEQTILDCQKVIADHEFTLFMTNAQSEAIIAWRKLKREKQYGTH